MTRGPESRQLKIAAIQQACSDDKETSLATSEALIREAVEGGAQLVVLQELHATLYSVRPRTFRSLSWPNPFPAPPATDCQRWQKSWVWCWSCLLYTSPSPRD